MIKFYCDVIKKHSKVIRDIIQKGSPILESFLFDWKNKVIHVRDNSKKFLKIKFDYQVDENDDPVKYQNYKNFYVNAEKFLLICDKYPFIYMELKEEADDIVSTSDVLKVSKCLNIQTGKEIIKLPFEYFDFDLNDFDIDIEEELEFTFSNNLYNHLKKALSYIEITEEHKELKGVFIKNNHLVGTNTKKLYDYKIPDISISDFSFTPDMIKFLLSFKQNEVISLKKNSNFVIFKLDDYTEIKLVNSMLLNLSIDLEGEKFKNSFNFNTYFKVDERELENCINFLEFFTIEAPANRMRLTFKNKKLIFEVIDNNYINKEVDLLEYSEELENYTFWLSNSFMKLVINDIKAKELVFQLKPVPSKESPLINCYSEENKDLHIIICKNRDI